eukprot:CAMPEP_0181464456 /NCGR_PEP_ID=MMETSP1110-20121109/35443_1 /TAXON_ID=174948 /ORGANISM="Symbiodinium sp., Strain CCMP421" /LENGTH=259 /DNA_ID=CAMNT_0023589193 /DNA_START=61 /DNA_END=837 /DNA_ORIENTATION=+
MALQFETLAVQRDTASGVMEVALNRPAQLNAFSPAMWVDLKNCFEAASSDPDTRCVVIHGGSCKLFTAGLDLKSSGAIFQQDTAVDLSRRALRMGPVITQCQEGISAIERCHKPVVCAMHSGVIGAGVDLASACDIRYCTEDAWFSVAEVNVGLAADVGTLQRLPKIVGNDSIVRELALTGRKMLSQEAKELGLVGKVLPSRDDCLAEARKIAKEIASKSPVAVVGTKVSLNYSRDHSVQEGLDHIKQWNSLHLLSEDV